MKFTDITWADCRIEKIYIEYDLAKFVIIDDDLQKTATVCCSGLAGLTNLCIWDDTIISDADIYPVKEADSEFLQKLYTAYDRDFDYGGGRILGENLLDLRITLLNGITFSVYCKEIDVIISN